METKDTKSTLNEVIKETLWYYFNMYVYATICPWLIIQLTINLRKECIHYYKHYIMSGKLHPILYHQEH